MEEKIRELSKKYRLHEEFFVKAIQIEKDRVVWQNRKLVPEIRKLIEKYAVLSK